MNHSSSGSSVTTPASAQRFVNGYCLGGMELRAATMKERLDAPLQADLAEAMLQADYAGAKSSGLDAKEG